VINGLAQGDTIDLAGVGFTGTATDQLTSGNVLQVFENTSTYSLQLNSSQNLSGLSFVLSSDGSSGTNVAVEEILTVSVGQTVSNATLTDGTYQDVYGKAVS